MMSPDEFYKNALDWALLALRDNQRISETVSFSEGYNFATNLALNMTNLYRGQIESKKVA